MVYNCIPTQTCVGSGAKSGISRSSRREQAYSPGIWDSTSRGGSLVLRGVRGDFVDLTSVSASLHTDHDMYLINGRI